MNASPTGNLTAFPANTGLLAGSFRYATMALLLFPLSYAAVWVGGWYGVGFVWAVVLLHCSIDCLAPSLGPALPRAKAVHNAWLVVQLPASLALIALLLLRASPQPVLEQVSLQLGLPFTPGEANPGVLLGAVVATAFMVAGNTIVAHEMMHRRSRWSRAYAWLLLTLLGDGQFGLAHMHGHHVNVATLRDPASARRRETVYRFFVRSTLGQYREAFLVDWERHDKLGRIRRVLCNRVVLSSLASIGLLALVAITLGTRPALALLLVMFLSKFLLEAINYIQHFGLVRVPYAPVEPRHSWDCHTRAAGTILFGLSFHSHHHAQPTCPMWDLQGSAKAPLLPHGYMFALLLAFVPPLWFRYMRPRLQRWDAHLASPEELSLLGLAGAASVAAAASPRDSVSHGQPAP